MFVYSYEHLDYLGHIMPAREAIRNESPFSFEHLTDAQIEERVNAVKKAFLDAGWAGDGEIGAIWLPPFVGVGVEDTYGAYLWHVKQSSNGISWIGYEMPLQFPPLLAQNNNLPANCLSFSIVKSATANFKRDVDQLVAESEEELNTIGGGDVADRLRAKILCHAQGLLVARFLEYLDDCYLNFLKDVISGGNTSKLRIRKLKADISLAATVTEDFVDPEGSDWLTLQGLIGDIWHSYQFLAFRQKFEDVTKPVGYKASEELNHQLQKHVEIRNCFQHHGGRLTQQAFEALGGNVGITRDSGEERVLAWKPLVMSRQELVNYRDRLLEFSSAFESHVDATVVSRHFRMPAPDSTAATL